MSAEDEASRKAALSQAWEAAARANSPLPAKLAAYATASREIIPDVTAAYDRMVARLAEAGAGSAAPSIGEQMPEILLSDSNGHLKPISELLATGPAVVSFNRGHWCPYCRFELRALNEAAPDIAAAGASLVSIVPECGPYMSRMIETNGLRFPVLCDLDHAYALQLGLAVWTGIELTALYKARGIDLPRFQGNAAGLLPIPATFVVDGAGIVRARFVDAEFRRRMPMDEILATLMAIAREKP